MAHTALKKADALALIRKAQKNAEERATKAEEGIEKSDLLSRGGFLGFFKELYCPMHDGKSIRHGSWGYYCVPCSFNAEKANKANSALDDFTPLETLALEAQEDGEVFFTEEEISLLRRWAPRD